MAYDTDLEIWRPCPIDTKSPYEVSNMGRLRSVAQTIRVGPSRTRPDGYDKNMPSRIKRIRYGASGYADVSLDGRPYRVHRLVALAFLPDGGQLRDQVNHIDANKKNNAASNLEWVTGSENIRHAWRSGIFTAEKCGRANRGKRLQGERLAHMWRIQRMGCVASGRAAVASGRQALITRLAAIATRKLSVDDVRSIRQAYAQGGISQAEIGARYGIAAGYVSRIVNRLVYQDLT